MKIYDSLPTYTEMFWSDTNAICQNVNGLVLLTILRYNEDEMLHLGIDRDHKYEVYIFTHTPGADQEPIFTCGDYDHLYRWYQEYRGLDAH